MPVISLVGPFNPVIKGQIEASIPQGFQLIHIPMQEEYAKLKESDYIIIRTLRLSGEHLIGADHLKLIHKWGAGYDNIDVDSISPFNIPVAVCVGGNSVPVAEMAVLHMLAVYRNLIPLDRLLRKNQWAKDIYSGRAYTLRGKTVGLLGAGNIGRKVAKLVQSFGAVVQYYDLFRLPEKAEQELNLRYVPFKELLKTSDIISIHVPLTKDTENLMDRTALSQMKPTAILVNTSRGGIVDEKALAEALREGRLLGAGLDAFADEPPGEDCPFFGLDNVVLTPHAGGNTADNAATMIDLCLKNIMAMQNGRPLLARSVVNNSLLKTPIEMEEI